MHPTNQSRHEFHPSAAWKKAGIKSLLVCTFTTAVNQYIQLKGLFIRSAWACILLLYSLIILLYDTVIKSSGLSLKVPAAYLLTLAVLQESNKYSFKFSASLHQHPGAECTCSFYHCNLVVNLSG